MPETVHEDSIAVIQSRMEHFRGVESVEFVSADSALADFRRHFPGEMLDLIDENPIPPFFRLTLVKEETQHDLKRATGSKSPVLDVWGTDGSGTQYDMEVQAGSGLDPLRFRYYGSAMDVDALPAGEDFDALPQRWVVVVLERDPDGPQRRCRHYRAREEDGSTLDDGAHLLYVNAAWRGDDELGRLMADFCERDPDKVGECDAQE